MEKIRIRISRDLKEFIENYADIFGMSQAEFIESACHHYVTCSRRDLREAVPTLKPIFLKYPATCSKCGRSLSVGEMAYWGRLEDGKTVIICQDCQVSSQSDKALARKYIKIRELSKTLSGLKKLAEEEADLLFDTDVLKKQEEYIRFLNSAVERFERYLQTSGPEEEKRLLHEILATLREAQRIEKGLDDFLFLQMQKMKKLRTKKKDASLA